MHLELNANTFVLSGRETEKRADTGYSTSKAHIRGGFIATLDQGVLSVSNFVAGAMFIKVSSPQEYGLYVALSSVLLLFAGFQNAVVNSPMTVLLPRMPPEKKGPLVSSLFVGQFTALGLIGIVSIPLFPFLLQLTLDVEATILVGAVFGLSTLAFLSRDFLRSYFYVSLKPLQSLFLDGVYAVTLVLSLLVVVRTGTLTAELGLLMVGLSAMIACAMMKKQIRQIFQHPFDLKSAFSQTWQYSKWAFAGVLASWLQQNTFIYLAGISSGVSSVAQVAAARLFMVPGSLLVAGWGNYVRPIMSRAAGVEGREKLLSLVKMGTIGLIIVITSYTVVLYFVFSWLSSRVLPPAYQDIGVYLVLWGGIGVVDVLASNLSNALQSLLLYRELSIIGFIAMFISVLFGAFLSHLHGSIGFLIGLVCSNVVLVVLCYLVIKRR